MKLYIYDNTFEGLLTAIFYSYSEKEQWTIIKDKFHIPSMLDEEINVKTEEDKFIRVSKSIIEKLNKERLQKIYYLYLSDIASADQLALDYLKLCFKYGVNINLAKNNDIIIEVDKYCRRVTNETHRIIGFVRFKEISPLSFYSSIEPDHNILPLIIDHFTNRFSDQNFIIHDLKREIAIFYNTKESIITTFTQEQAASLLKSNNDANFESLWKTFYNSVNIKERQNLRQQRGYMPKRYWKHLTEFKN